MQPQRMQNEWRQGFPNSNLSCYFNSFVQMYLQCLENLSWQDSSGSQFHQLAMRLKSINPINLKHYLKSMNDCLTYQNQHLKQGNDPIRVLSAVIQDTNSSKKMMLKYLPKRFKNDYKELAENSSETAFLFQSIIGKGYWCNNCNEGTIIDEKINYLITLNNENNKIQNNQIIQTLMNSFFLSDQIQQDLKCSKCHGITEKVEGFLKLPQFLYLNLTEANTNNIKMDDQISLYNEAECNVVKYQLQGIINHPPAHYTYCRKDGDNGWINYDDSYVHNIEKPKFVKGLLYVATTNKDKNINRLEVDFQSSKIIQSNPFTQKFNNISTKIIFHELCESYNDLQIIEDGFQSCSFRGHFSDNQVIIKVFNNVHQGAENEKYDNLTTRIHYIKSNLIIQSASEIFFEDSKSYRITSVIYNLETIQSKLCNFTEEMRISIFLQIIQLIQLIQHHSFQCPSIELENIWINSQNQISILSTHLYAIQFSKEQQTSTHIIYWLRLLLSSLFPSSYKASDKIEKCLKRNITESDINYDHILLELTELLSPSQNYHEDEQTCTPRYQNQEDLSKILNDEIFQLLKQSPSNISQDNLQESISFLKSKNCEVKKIQKIETYGCILQGVYKNQNVTIRFFGVSNELMTSFQIEGLQTKLINSPNVTKLIDCFVHKNKNMIYFIEEKIVGVDYKIWLKENQVLSEEKRLQVLKGIFEGYQALKNQEIIVGNLMKNDIILMTKNDLPILNGFGIMDITECTFLNVVQKGKMNYNYQEFIQKSLSEDYQNLFEILNLLSKESYFSYFKQILLDDIPEKRIIEMIVEKIEKRMQSIIQQVICKTGEQQRISILIKDKENSSLCNIPSIPLRSTIFQLKQYINYVNFPYVLLNVNYGKLKDQLTLLDYQITNNSELVAFEIPEALRSQYGLFLKDNKTNKTKQYLIFLQLDGSESILEIKEKIYQKEKYPTNKQELFYNDQILDDRLILAQYQIGSKTLFLSIKEEESEIYYF